MPDPQTPEVLVIGGGLAGLCAALEARAAGATVLMVEAAPKPLRGGNARHARNFRVCHDQPSALSPGVYTEAEFIAEFTATAGPHGDAALIRRYAQESAALPGWFQRQGVILQTKSIPWSRKTVFLLGGGMAALNALYLQAQRVGVQVAYGTTATLSEEGTLSEGAEGGVRLSPGFCRVSPKATVVCTGGEQAALERLGAWINRGSPYVTGEGLHSLLALGAEPVGAAGACHQVAVDARSPRHDGGIVTRIDGFALGMVVDRSGQRFRDEMAETSPRRYAVWGQAVAACPGQWAALVVDATHRPHLPVMIYPPLEAPTLEALATRLEVPAPALIQAAGESGRVAVPPFFAYPIRPGITFTARGVRVTDQGRVQGLARSDLFAAGMILAPNLLGTGYLAGAGITVSAISGRHAGREAARHALRPL